MDENVIFIGNITRNNGKSARMGMWTPFMATGGNGYFSTLSLVCFNFFVTEAWFSRNLVSASPHNFLSCISRKIRVDLKQGSSIFDFMAAFIIQGFLGAKGNRNV